MTAVPVVTVPGEMSRLRPLPAARYIHPRATALVEREGDHDANLDVADENAPNYLSWVTDLCRPHLGERVLEVGAGVGRLTGFFVERGCEIIATEGRPENVAEFARRHPTIGARQADVEESLERLGRFDVVFCYGVLYHLESPLRALRNMAAVCDGLLLLETMVCDARLPLIRLEDETRAANQALAGVAHRPSPAWVVMAANRAGFDHVYGVAEPPNHPDFRFKPLGNLDTERDGALLRAVFIASRQPLESDRLQALLDADDADVGGDV